MALTKLTSVDKSVAKKLLATINSSTLNDLSQAYEFPTVAAMAASSITFPLTKSLHVAGENNSFVNYIVVNSAADVDLGGGLWAKEITLGNPVVTNPISATLEASVRQRFLGSQTGGLVYDQGRHVVIFGDSISWGAHASNLFDKTWVSILRRNYLNEVEKTNHGFTAIALTSVEDVHEVTRTGTWSNFEGGAAVGSPTGYFAVSEDASATMTITVPVFKRRFTIMYRRGIGYGEFDVEVNGTIIDTINADGTSDPDVAGTSLGYAKTANYEVKGLSGAPNCIIRILKKDSNRNAFTGVYYDDVPSQFSVDNFSHSGRRLYYASEEVIKRAITGSDVFILALGHNDQSHIESTPSLMDDFLDRLNWVEEQSALYNVKVIVLDFIWGKTIEDSPTRQALSAMGTKANITYLPTPDYFGYTGTASTTDLINKYNLFVDNSHPNDAGHALIGEVVCKVLGLSDSNSRYPVSKQGWLPLQGMDSYLKNQTANFQKVSAYKVDKRELRLRLIIKNATGTALAAGLYEIIDLGIQTWRSAKPFVPALTGSAVDSGYLGVEMNENGVVSLRVRTGNTVVFPAGEFIFQL